MILTLSQHHRNVADTFVDSTGDGIGNRIRCSVNLAFDRWDNAGLLALCLTSDEETTLKRSWDTLDKSNIPPDVVAQFDRLINKARGGLSARIR